MKKSIKNIFTTINLSSSVKNFGVKAKQYALTNILFITFIITTVINGWLIRSVTIGNTLDFKPLLADLVVVLLVASFSYFIKPKHRFKYFLLCSILFTFICIVNGIYYKNYLSFTSISLLATLSQLGDQTGALIENILEVKDFIYVWQVFALVFVHLQLRKRDYYEKVEKAETSKIRFLNTIVVDLILLGLFISMLNGSDLNRIQKQWNREFVVKSFGIYTYQFNDLFVYMRMRLNSMFGFDEAKRHFREFYDDVPDEPAHTNMYTDIFKGKNVLVIHAESMMGFLISDRNKNWEPASFNGIEVTPTLNKLASEGIYFTNFYAQEGAGTSSDTEFTFNSSLMPSSSGTVFMNYFDREYATTPKMLREMGYHTFSMHGNKSAVWNRAAVHPQLGFNHFYAYTGAYQIDEEIGLGLSDGSFFRQSIDLIKDVDEKYDNWYGLMITLTNHTPFSAINAYSEENDWLYEVNARMTAFNEQTNQTEEIVRPYLEGTRIGNYMKNGHYADEAIGAFIDSLDEAGLLENTVIVIYGDHDNKLRKSEYNRYYNYDPETDTIRTEEDEEFVRINDYDYEINRSVPLIVWTKDLKGTEYNKRIDTVMGMIDVQPTLANMFGFYNKFALGVDIMSAEENIVVFPNGDWLTNKLYYNGSKSAFQQIDINAEITAEYLERGMERVDLINTLSNSIIIHDLIKRVGHNLDNELLEEVTGGD